MVVCSSRIRNWTHLLKRFLAFYHILFLMFNYTNSLILFFDGLCAPMCFFPLITQLNNNISLFLAMEGPEGNRSEPLLYDVGKSHPALAGKSANNRGADTVTGHVRAVLPRTFFSVGDCLNLASRWQAGLLSRRDDSSCRGGICCAQWTPPGHLRWTPGFQLCLKKHP